MTITYKQRIQKSRSYKNSYICSASCNPASSWHVVNTDYPLRVLHTLSTVACIFPSIIINCFKPVGSAARALHTYQSRYGLEQHVPVTSNFNDFGLSPTGIEHRAKYIANHYVYCGASCKEHTIPCFDNILTSLLRHIPDNQAPYTFTNSQVKCCQALTFYKDYVKNWPGWLSRSDFFLSFYFYYLPRQKTKPRKCLPSSFSLSCLASL